jgi:hypothetical protein
MRQPSNSPAPMDRDDPARKVAGLGARKARFGDHLGELFLAREGANAFDEIAVGRAIAGHDLSHRRDRGHRIGIIKRIEPRHIDMGEFEALKLAARFQDSESLGERPVDVSDVADAESDRVGIEALLGERQRFGIGDDEMAALAKSFAMGALGSLIHHLCRNVGNRDLCAGAPRSCDPEGDVAGSSCDIEHVEWPAPLGNSKKGHKIVLPQPVKTARHQVIHLVIAVGDLGEDLIDEALLFLLRHAPITESRLRSLLAHGGGP